MLPNIKIESMTNTFRENCNCFIIIDLVDLILFGLFMPKCLICCLFTYEFDETMFQKLSAILFLEECIGTEDVGMGMGVLFQWQQSLFFNEGEQDSFFYYRAY